MHHERLEEEEDVELAEGEEDADLTDLNIYIYIKKKILMCSFCYLNFIIIIYFFSKNILSNNLK